MRSKSTSAPRAEGFEALLPCLCGSAYGLRQDEGAVRMPCSFCTEELVAAADDATGPVTRTSERLELMASSPSTEDSKEKPPSSRPDNLMGSRPSISSMASTIVDLEFERMGVEAELSLPLARESIEKALRISERDQLGGAAPARQTCSLRKEGTPRAGTRPQTREEPGLPSARVSAGPVRV